MQDCQHGRVIAPVRPQAAGTRERRASPSCHDGVHGRRARGSAVHLRCVGQADKRPQPPCARALQRRARPLGSSKRRPQHQRVCLPKDGVRRVARQGGRPTSAGRQRGRPRPRTRYPQRSVVHSGRQRGDRLCPRRGQHGALHCPPARRSAGSNAPAGHAERRGSARPDANCHQQFVLARARSGQRGRGRGRWLGRCQPLKEPLPSLRRAQLQDGADSRRGRTRCRKGWRGRGGCCRRPGAIGSSSRQSAARLERGHRHCPAQREQPRDAGAHQGHAPNFAGMEGGRVLVSAAKHVLVPLHSRLCGAERFGPPSRVSLTDCSLGGFSAAPQGLVQSHADPDSCFAVVPPALRGALQQQLRRRSLHRDPPLVALDLCRGLAWHRDSRRVPRFREERCPGGPPTCVEPRGRGGRGSRRRRSRRRPGVGTGHHLRVGRRAAQ